MHTFHFVTALKLDRQTSVACANSACTTPSPSLSHRPLRWTMILDPQRHSCEETPSPEANAEDSDIEENILALALDEVRHTSRSHLWHELLRKLHRSPLFVQLRTYNLGASPRMRRFASCSVWKLAKCDSPSSLLLLLLLTRLTRHAGESGTRLVDMGAKCQ